MKMILICLSLLMITGCSLVNEEDKIPKEYEGLCKERRTVTFKEVADVNLKEDMVQYISKEGDASYRYDKYSVQSKSGFYEQYTLPNKYHVVINWYDDIWYNCDPLATVPSFKDGTFKNQYIDAKVFTLTIVDFETLDTLKTIDVLQILNDNYEDYQISHFQGSSKVIVRDGKYYHPVPIFKRPNKIVDGQLMDVAVLLIDIETGDFKLSTTPYEDFITISFPFDTRDPYAILMGSSRDETPWYLGAANGIPMDVIYPLVWQGTEFENIITIETNASYLPESNERLYTLFPKLKDVRDTYINTEKGKTMYFQLNREEFPTWQDVLKLFMEDGQEISFEKWDYESEEAYYNGKRYYGDYETALTEFKEALKAQGFEEPTRK